MEDACPQGCDQSIYERVLALRETRLDHDLISAEVNRAIDDGKKMADRLRQKEKQLAKEALQADVEMEHFQQLKQTALNDIDVTVPLKLSQIYPFVGSGALTNPCEYRPDESAGHDSQSQSGHYPSQITSVNHPFASFAESPVDDAQLQAEIKSLQSAENRVLVEQLTMQSHIIVDIRCGTMTH